MSEGEHSDRSQRAARSEHAADPQKEKTPPRQAEHALSSLGQAKEVGGPAGPEPTRYGDWERKGRCIDF